jgi:hypothetical protein
MSVPLTVQGVTFQYPQQGDNNWGPTLTGWSTAVTNALAGFPSPGVAVLAPYPGILNFANDTNTGYLPLSTNGSNQLTFNGNIVNTLSIPVTVSNGGTGDTSLTAYSVLCGGTTSTGPVQSVSGLGLSGQALVSNGAAALPTWQNVAGSGTVNTGTAGNFGYYATSSTVISDSGVSRTAPIFTAQVTGSSFKATQATNQLQFASSGNQLQAISVTATSTVGEVFTVPDPGTSANFVLTQGTQTISGPTTLSSFTGTLNSALAAGGNKITGLANGTTSSDAAAFGQIPTIPTNFAPTTTHVTSSGTYTTPTSPRTPLYLRVKMVGGGGGGSGSGTTGGGTGANGTASTFGSNSAGGGTGGTYASAGASGGANSILGVTLVRNQTGGSGGGSVQLSNTLAIADGGEIGGATFYSSGAKAMGSGSPGQSGESQTGEGGQGGGIAAIAAAITGSGGGGGGYLEFIITSPVSSYSVTPGSGGNGGTAGTNGFAGGNGATGDIIVEEYYQ